MSITSDVCGFHLPALTHLDITDQLQENTPVPV